MSIESASGLLGSDLILSFIQESQQWVNEGMTKNNREGRPFGINNFWAWHIKEDKNAAISEARQELVLRGVLEKRYTDALLSAEDSQFVQDNKGAFWAAWGMKTDRIRGVPDSIINSLIDGMSSTGDLSDLDREIGRFKTFNKAGLTEIAFRVNKNKWGQSKNRPFRGYIWLPTGAVFAKQMA